MSEDTPVLLHMDGMAHEATCMLTMREGAYIFARQFKFFLASIRTRGPGAFGICLVTMLDKRILIRYKLSSTKIPEYLSEK